MNTREGAVGENPAAPPAAGAPIVEWALWYAEAHRWPVFPVHSIRDGVCTCGGGCDKPGKHPRTTNGFLDASLDPEQIRKWWTRFPDANIATPYPSVLDCDLPRDSDPADGVAEYRKLEKKHGIVAGAAIAHSGGSGLHVYFAPGSPGGSVGPGLSMRGNGLYAVLPPSRHESGRSYRWERPPIAGRPLPPAPDWLAKKQTAATKKLKTKVFDSAEKIPANERHYALAAFVGDLRRRHPTLTAEEARVLAHAWRVERCEAPEEKVSDVNGLIDYVYAKDPPEAAEPWQGPVPDGAQLLDEIDGFLSHYMVMSEHERVVCSVYVVATYAHDLFEQIGYLRVSSATKRCGKSRLLDILELLVRSPLPSSGMSEASLFRSLDDRPRTLLFDEIGKVLGEAQRDRNSDLLRVLLNGYTVGKPVQRCVGEGTKQEVVDFQVYGPKVLAGTGQLDDQILDRCFPIELRRKRRDEAVTRLRRRTAKAESADLRARTAAWVAAHADALHEARPVLPDELDDRGQDIAEPLLAIADLAGGEWPARTRAACIALRSGSDELEEDIGVELLADIERAFADDDKLTTEELLKRLNADPERPWAHWSKGLPMNPLQLARKLKPFGIRPKLLRLAQGVSRGYERAAFEDVFTRYAPSTASQPVTPVTSAQPSQTEPISTRYNEASVTGSKNGSNPHGSVDVTGVTGKNPKKGGQEEPLDIGTATLGELLEAFSAEAEGGKA